MRRIKELDNLEHRDLMDLVIEAISKTYGRTRRPVNVETIKKYLHDKVLFDDIDKELFDAIDALLVKEEIVARMPRSLETSKAELAFVAKKDLQSISNQTS